MAFPYHGRRPDSLMQARDAIQSPEHIVARIPPLSAAKDSPVEGREFEPSVPRKIETALSRPSFSPLRHHVQPERSTRAIRRFGCKRRRLRSNFIAAHLGETKDYAQWPRYLGNIGKRREGTMSHGRTLRRRVLALGLGGIAGLGL